MKKNLFLSIIIAFTIISVIFIKNQFSYLLLSNATYGLPALVKIGHIQNLFIGSSMYRQGIDIKILQKELSASNYILTYNGNQPISEYLQLKYLLDHNVEIENLFIDMYVYTAYSSPSISDEKLFLEIDFSEKWQLWSHIKTNDFVTNINILWRMFITSNNELLLTWPLSSAIINSQFHNGGTLARTASASAEALNKTAIPSLPEDEMNSTQKFYLTEIIALAQENDINIIFLETPKHIRVSSDASYLAAMCAYANFLNEEHIPYIVSENTWKNLIKSKYVYYYKFNTDDASYFMDAIHLSYQGRVQFTQVLLNLANTYLK